jgi:hypothetical protein
VTRDALCKAAALGSAAALLAAAGGPALAARHRASQAPIVIGFANPLTGSEAS